MAEKPDREEDDKWVQLIGLEPKDKDKEIQTQIQLGTFHRHAKTGKSTGSCFAAGTLVVNQLSTSAARSKIKKTISTIIFLEPGASLFHFILEMFSKSGGVSACLQAATGEIADNKSRMS